MPRRLTPFARILAAGIVLRLILVFSLPLYPARNPLPGYNDEPMHLQYVRYLDEWGRWPIWSAEESRSDSLVDEYPQPPLYYAAALPAYRVGEWIRVGCGLYGARLVSVFFGIVAALFVFWSARRLTGDHRTALGALAAAALAPNSVVFSSLVTNDAMLFGFAAMAFHSVLLSRAGEGGAVRQVKTGLMLGVAVWGKMTALALLPLGLWAAPRGVSRDDRLMARWRVLVVAICAVMPLVVWNVSHYGQVAPTVSIYTPEETLGRSGGGLSHPVQAAKYLLRTAAQPLEKAWGSPLEKGTSLVWVAGALLLTAIGWWSLRRSSDRWLLVAGILFPLAALGYYNIRFFQIEFRLLGPAFAPLAILAGAGMGRLKLPLWAQGLFWAGPILILPIITTTLLG